MLRGVEEGEGLNELGAGAGAGVGVGRDGSVGSASGSMKKREA